jgi:Alkaline and neutral invertase
MNSYQSQEIALAKQAAIKVLLHNAHGPFHGLPRTAGWGYPEPYTRDLMLSALGFAVSGNVKLVQLIERTLVTLSKNQSENGHIPSMVHDAENRGASDTTPLFLLATAIFRSLSGQHQFLEEAVNRAVKWMEYQRPSDDYLIAQLPTSDWRDEQWVLGYGLYVNTIVYSYLNMLNMDKAAADIREQMHCFTITKKTVHAHVHGGLTVKHKPYYAMWAYKVYSSERFDLLGNSMAILSGIAPPTRAVKMTNWIALECKEMMKKGELGIELAPNFFPFIYPGQPDWIERYAEFNLPGHYHNGGIWPFVSAFHVAALVAAGRPSMALNNLMALTQLVKKGVNTELEYGFNEWYDPANGKPMGQDWQTWSAALYLYAAVCVETNHTPFFDQMRKKN